MFYLALMGEQPIPVFSHLWQLEEITQVGVTATNTTKLVANNVINCIKREPAPKHRKILPTLLVSAYDLAGIIQQIRLNLVGEPDELCFNLTLGNKIMSLTFVPGRGWHRLW